MFFLSSRRRHTMCDCDWSSDVCSSDLPPHIVMVFDESSFDARAIPGIKTPPGYVVHFKSSDGLQRSLMVEGAGGDRKSTRLNSSHSQISYAGFCLTKKMSALAITTRSK